MKNLQMGLVGASLLGFAQFQIAKAAPFPSATLSNKNISVELYLPDPTRGYYRSTRFDWSGIPGKVTSGGISYFRDFVEPQDPTNTTAGRGFIEEFRMPVGYGEGNRFLKIGVGILEKTDSAPYDYGGKYLAVDLGKWVTQIKGARAEFEHILPAVSGYRVAYRKEIEITNQILWITHFLKNIGEKAVQTTHYGHHFVTWGRGPVDPSTRLDFNFFLAFANNQKDRYRFDDNKVLFNRALGDHELTWILMDGFIPGQQHLSFSIYRSPIQAGLEMVAHFPVNTYGLFMSGHSISPEPNYDINLEPGKSCRWVAKYRFYQGTPVEYPLTQLRQNSQKCLKGLTVDGREWGPFNLKKTNYTLVMGPGQGLPVLGALTYSPGDRVGLVQPTDKLPQGAVFLLPEGKGPTNSIFHFQCRPMTCDGVATSATNGADPRATLDDDPDTSWIAEGAGPYLEYEWREPRAFQQAGVAWKNGHMRQFTFQILVSMDGKNWVTAYAGQSSGLTTEMEWVSLAKTPAYRFLRLVGGGNSKSKVNNIVEVKWK